MQKVCSAKALLCLTLSTYLVLQQLSLFQTNTKSLKPNVKTLNIFVETFFSPDIFGLTPSPSFGRVSLRQLESFPK